MPTPLQQIECVLKHSKKNDPDYAAFRSKTTSLTVLGHRLPAMQEIERTGFSFYNKSTDEILVTWNSVWITSNIHEALYLPLFYYRRHKTELDLKHWRVMKRWIDQVENWEHADALCMLYSIMYERFPKQIESTLFKWNRSSNPWKRRASIVSTIYYASKNRKAPSISTVLKLIEPLVKDEDAYVQKAVGWQLRECYNIEPKKTLAFINKHLTDLSALSFSYATEKLSKAQKTPMKAKRRQSRLISR
jgi:3-methyladenine DNA glycosylase AlkD